VQLRDTVTVASCGDDCSVRVCDLRSPTTTATACSITAALATVHRGSTHTVRWHTGSGQEHMLLTAGLDETIKMFDIRKCDAPVKEYTGHVPYKLAKLKAIHRPEFYASGAAIITCGER
jgi:WD40 repeat protein